MLTKQKRRWLFVDSMVLTALWVVFILARSAKPAQESSAESGWVLELIRRLIPAIGMHTIRKLAHFTEFGILGLLLWLDCRFWKKGRWWAPLVAGLAVAAADEFFQTFIPGRSGQLTDILIDFSGVLTAVLLANILATAISTKKPQGRRMPAQRDEPSASPQRTFQKKERL